MTPEEALALLKLIAQLAQLVNQTTEPQTEATNGQVPVGVEMT